MDVSNTTDDKTDYRTSSTIPKIGEEILSPWTTITAGEVTTIPDLPCPFTIEFRVGGKIVEFRVGGKIVQTMTCYEPLRRIVLMKTGSGYRVRRLKKLPLRAQPPRQMKPKPPQPRRQRTVQVRKDQNRRSA